MARLPNAFHAKETGDSGLANLRACWKNDKVQQLTLRRAQKLKAKCSERVKGDLDAYGVFVDKFRRISPTVDESIEGD